MTDELSPSQAAARIGATTRSVQRWIATGRLPARRVGGRWRVASDALDAFAGPAGAAIAGADTDTRPPIRRLFIANRGEIAARITRTCDRLGIAAIVPPTDGPDARRPPRHRRGRRGRRGRPTPTPSTPASASSPRTPPSPRPSIAAGIRWIGPPPARDPGDGRQGRRAPARAPPRHPDDRRLRRRRPDRRGPDAGRRSGSATRSSSSRRPAAAARACGRSATPADLPAQLAAARREAQAAFGDDRLILERFLEGPRHVEVQVLFDGHGHGVHLGERDCSLQRRHQKVLEETPSPAVRPAIRRRLTDAALALAARGRLRRAPGRASSSSTTPATFFFLEMNTRLQVEHPVTELVTGRDLVADQIRIAARRAARVRASADVRPDRPRDRGPPLRRGRRGRLPAGDRAGPRASAGRAGDGHPGRRRDRARRRGRPAGSTRCSRRSSPTAPTGARRWPA